MDFKKLMLISAGVFVVVVVIFVVFLKPSGEDISPITKEAQKMVKNNQKDEAIHSLLENEKKLDRQGKTLLKELKVEFYPIYLEKAEKAFNDEEYIVALERYKKVLTVIPSGTDPKPVEDNIKELEELADEILKAQEDYNQYMDTFKITIKNSNTLLSDFRSMLDQMEVGSISASDFVSHFKSEVDSSNTITNRLDSALAVSNKKLLDVHKEVVNMASAQHDLILTSLTLNDENKAQLLGKFRTQYLSLKQEQIILIQKLNDFAEKNHLEKVKIEQDENETTIPSTEKEHDTIEPTKKTDKATESLDESVSSENKADRPTEETSEQPEEKQE
ncbi:hypothetical protein [Virgibacillus halodenitrificans]|uniref:hypothetical protein n=1 Tax=Virgibacillus halodenitrificans TaxID=1482 RepID=UPI000EF472CA|nr:hypothetical protein [Virgibacillus halodenitrificans]